MTTKTITVPRDRIAEVVRFLKHNQVDHMPIRRNRGGDGRYTFDITLKDEASVTALILWFA